MKRSSYIRLRAFRDSLPILAGYGSMGLAAGILLAAKGGLSLAPLWAFLSSGLWVSGTMSFACVPEFAARDGIFTIAAAVLAVNFRYMFYGFSMLSRWKNAGLPRKLYLILMLTDENYALEASCRIKDEKSFLSYCTALSLLNHSYWVCGVTCGALGVYALGKAFDAETIRRWTNGIEFSMAAVFVVVLTDQIRDFAKRIFRRG